MCCIDMWTFPSTYLDQMVIMETHISVQVCRCGDNSIWLGNIKICNVIAFRYMISFEAHHRTQGGLIMATREA